MSNLRILYKDLVPLNDALTMAVGASASGFPLSNLLNPRKSKVWRSTNLSPPTIKVTWPSPISLDCFILAFGNFIDGSLIRIKLYDDPSAGSLLFDSNNISINHNYQPPRGFTTLGLASFPYGGGIHFSNFFPLTSGVRRAEIQIYSSGNPDGYVEVSSMMAGVSFQPEDNADYGASIIFEDSTKKIVTGAGEELASRGVIRRGIAFSMADMSENDKNNFVSIFRQIGTSTPIFLSVLPKDFVDNESLAMQVYGRLDDGLQMILSAYSLYSGSLKIMEI